jgi:hypothetical protein
MYKEDDMNPEKGDHAYLKDVKKKKETRDPEKNNLSFVRLRLSPREGNIETLVAVARKFGLRVHILDDEQEEEEVEAGRIEVEISPLPGTILPDWDKFWKEYAQAKKKR